MAKKTWTFRQSPGLRTPCGPADPTFGPFRPCRRRCELRHAVNYGADHPAAIPSSPGCDTFMFFASGLCRACLTCPEARI